jgi:site-specific recombinase XerD
MESKRRFRLGQEAYVRYGQLLNDYIYWLRNYRNLAEDTVISYRRYITIFLNWINYYLHLKKLSSLSHDNTETFFLRYSDNHEFGSREQMQSALRVFLRFCFKQGYIKRDLSLAVPTLRTYKLARIPHIIAEEEIQKILDHIDKKTKVGRRDYAIIQLLTKYGVRSKQIRKLRLTDIDWRKNQIYFPSMKFGKDILQPLMADVGEALLDYLQNGRRKCSYPEVFLTVNGPCKPINSPCIIYSIITRRAHDAGVNLPKAGPHVLRHTFATRMLERGHSLKSVADMLGHRCLQTTFIYTKVDFQNLNNVALDWPEEES